jgi:N-acetylglucosaminyldiphosphoundecaprenol N-acetyl-beta-D-mannosaminyltransferase
MSTRSQRVDVMSVAFDDLDEPAVVDRLAGELAAGRGGWVVTPNLDILRQTERSRSIQELVNSADLVLADGAPIVGAARLAATGPELERLPGSDLIWSLHAAAARHGWSTMLLGGHTPDVANRAAARLHDRFPGLRRPAVHCPPFGFEDDPIELQRIETAVAVADPDVVFVGLGFPKQERLIQRLAHAFPDVWFVGCGAAVDFVAGDTVRAPEWMQRFGLEWLHRLLQEPGRLYRRYLVAGPPFLARLGAWAVRRRIAERRGHLIRSTRRGRYPSRPAGAAGTSLSS